MVDTRAEIADYSCMERIRQARKEASDLLREELCVRRCRRLPCDRPCFVAQKNLCYMVACTLYVAASWN